MVAKRSPIDASAAPSMVESESSAAMSMSSWLRFEDTPFVRVSTVSEALICSGRSLFEKAKRTRIASEAESGSSGIVPLAAAAGAVAGAAEGASTAGALAAGTSAAEALLSGAAGAASSLGADASDCARSG